MNTYFHCVASLSSLFNLLFLLLLPPLLLCNVVAIGSADRFLLRTKRDPNANIFTVYRFVPRSIGSVDYLKNLSRENDLQLDFWREASGVGRPVDIMVYPEHKWKFVEMFKKGNMTFSVLIEDVEKLIREKEQNSLRKDHVLYDYSGRNGSLGAYNIFRYVGYDETVRYLEYLQYKFPHILKIVNLGHTFEGRLLKLVKIGNPLDSETKRAIWIDAGIHPREWVSHVTAVYFIQTLVANYGLDPQITGYVNNFTWYIVPNFNPDGYEYSRSSSDPRVRSWRKNKSMRPGCTIDLCCAGVDLNRNFDILWNQFGSSDNRCSHVYHGESPFSEMEARAVRDFVLLHKKELDAYITLHAHSQLWAYPYGYKKGAYPLDIKDLHVIAIRATKALESLYGTKYKVGSSADLLDYAASGGSDDWVKSKVGIKFVYLVELRPEEEVSMGFIYEEEHLPFIARETWEGVKVVADAVRRVNEIRAKRLRKYFSRLRKQRRYNSQKIVYRNGRYIMIDGQHSSFQPYRQVKRKCPVRRKPASL